MLSVQTKDNPQFLINFLLCLSNKGYSLLHVICLHKKGKTNQSNKLTKTGKPANISIRCLRLLCLNPLFDLFQIINWLRGSATASKDGGMRILSHESQSFGKEIGRSIAEWSRILRQAVGNATPSQVPESCRSLLSKIYNRHYCWTLPKRQRIYRKVSHHKSLLLYRTIYELYLQVFEPKHLYKVLQLLDPLDHLPAQVTNCF